MTVRTIDLCIAAPISNQDAISRCQKKTQKRKVRGSCQLQLRIVNCASQVARNLAVENSLHAGAGVTAAVNSRAPPLSLKSWRHATAMKPQGTSSNNWMRDMRLPYA
mmetsp:Transcript_20649/g.27866  ORF Transcript_20649/g.27866 Transcript_20649/m.27866 type:complete len:107 (-) Transcript_20649:491-811(-)